MNVLITNGQQLCHDLINHLRRRNFPTDNGNFNHQPEDIILEVFKNLSKPSDLANFPLVCKKFERVQITYINKFLPNEIHKIGLLTFDLGTLDIFKKEITITDSRNMEEREQFCFAVAKSLPQYHYFKVFAGPADYFYAVKHTKNVNVYRSLSNINNPLVNDQDNISFVKNNYKQIKLKSDL